MDIGTQANIIPSAVFNSIKGTQHSKTTKVTLTGFNGSEIPVVGVARIICKYKDKQIDFDFFVVEAEGHPPPLLLGAVKNMSGTELD